MQRIVLAAAMSAALSACAGGAGVRLPKIDPATQVQLIKACALYQAQKAPAAFVASLVPVPGVGAGVTAAQGIADAACAAVAAASPATKPTP